MKSSGILQLIIIVILLVSAFYIARYLTGVQEKIELTEKAFTELETYNLSDLHIASSQKVYVPVNSYLKRNTARSTVYLNVLLSIRNTDPQDPIVVSKVDYYDSQGKLSREYIQEPVIVNPMATLEYFIDQADTTGGSGANFLVEWGADSMVYEPLIEAVMYGIEGSRGITLKSQGIVVEGVK